MFERIDTGIAINTWERLVLAHHDNITIADNPNLYFFYNDFLKLPAFYLFLKSGDQIDGLFAFVKAGRVYISLPHLSYGGIIWFSKKKSSVNPILVEKLVAEVNTEKLAPGFYEIDYNKVIERTSLEDPKIEVRSPDPIYTTNQPDKVVNVIKIKDSGQIELNFFKPEIRRKIKKSLKSGISVKMGNKKLVKDFTTVYNRNMHRKGSPSLGKQFFEALRSTPGIHSEIFVAYKDSKPIGGAFAMWYNGYYENIWFSTLSKYNNFYVSYLLHWEMIKSAVDKKAEIYSMGRSSIGSGTHKYKLQWPTDEIYLYFSTNCPGPAKIKKLMWVPKVWKRLPSAIVDRLGPVLAKRLY